MQKRFLIGSAILVGALALTGCTADDEPAATNTPVSKPSVTPSEPEVEETDEPLTEPVSPTPTYATIEEFAAGVECADFEADDTPVEGATASGECGDLDLWLFATPEERDVALNANQTGETPDIFLVGANWLVKLDRGGDLDELSSLLAKLGGFIVPVPS